MIIYVVRHGWTELNKKGVVQGHVDSVLAPEGIETAEKIRELLGGEEIEVIFSSDLGRCVQTSKIINNFLNKDLIKTSELRERDFGVLNGAPAEVVRKELVLSNPDELAPEGESFNQMKKRVLDFIKSLNGNRFNKVLLVTHEGCVRAMLSEYYKANIDSEKCESSSEKVYKFEIVDGDFVKLEIVEIIK